MTQPAIPIPSGIGGVGSQFRDAISTIEAQGQATTPGAFGQIVSLGVLPAGVWELTFTAAYGAIGDVVNNMAWQFGGVNKANLPVQGVANGVPVSTTYTQICDGVGAVRVVAVAAAAAGAVYGCTAVARRVG